MSSSSENSQPSVFSDTGLGNLHLFMEDRATLIFENFSISSSEQVTLTVNPPALDGVTVEELAAAIDDAVVTFEEIDGEELEATPEPTIEAASTATPAISEPPSDQGLTNLTASQVHAAVAQFSNNEGWTFHDADEVITNESAYSYRSGKVLTKDGGRGGYLTVCGAREQGATNECLQDVWTPWGPFWDSFTW